MDISYWSVSSSSRMGRGCGKGIRWGGGNHSFSQLQVLQVHDNLV